MSIEKARQVGGDEPLPQAVLELQQLVLGMFLIWDVLEKDYNTQELVERAVLADWSRRNKVGKARAFEALVLQKDQLMDKPWAHYMHCRDFKEEGWVNVLISLPIDNADVLAEIKSVLEARPFKDKEAANEGNAKRKVAPLR